MYKNLRIIFTILSAVFLAVAIPLGVFFGYPGWIAALIGAGIFFVLMLLCKQSQEAAEQKAEQMQKAKEKAEADGETEDSTQPKLPKNALQRPRYKRKK